MTSPFKRSNFIGNGYKQDGYVAGIPLMFEPVVFEYSPALIEERSSVFDGNFPKPMSVTNKMSAAIMEKKIKSWDIKDNTGQPLPITALNILNLQNVLFNRLEEIVFGYRASDINPAWPDETKQAESDLLVSALGKDVGATREAKEVKN